MTCRGGGAGFARARRRGRREREQRGEREDAAERRLRAKRGARGHTSSSGLGTTTREEDASAACEG